MCMQAGPSQQVSLVSRGLGAIQTKDTAKFGNAQYTMMLINWVPGCLGGVTWCRDVAGPRALASLKLRLSDPSGLAANLE